MNEGRDSGCKMGSCSQGLGSGGGAGADSAWLPGNYPEAPGPQPWQSWARVRQSMALSLCAICFTHSLQRTELRGGRSHRGSNGPEGLPVGPKVGQKILRIWVRTPGLGQLC